MSGTSRSGIIGSAACIIRDIGFTTWLLCGELCPYYYYQTQLGWLSGDGTSFCSSSMLHVHGCGQELDGGASMLMHNCDGTHSVLHVLIAGASIGLGESGACVLDFHRIYHCRSGAPAPPPAPFMPHQPALHSSARTGPHPRRLRRS